MSVNSSCEDGVVTVTLDWPEKGNAIDPGNAEELARVLTSDAVAEADVAVLTGNGTFCGGGDLSAVLDVVAAGPDAVRDLLYTIFHALMRTFVHLPIPLLAAVDGPAMGLGMDLAVCDWRSMGPGGWFKQGWGGLGVIPGTGGEYLLRRYSPAALWTLLGSNHAVSMDEAARLGLAVPAPQGALAAATTRARELRRVPRTALHAYVDLYRADLRAEFPAHLELCLMYQADLLCSSDFRQRAELVLRRS